MPFTLSHPAASVPLARRGLVLSALVVGSMAPDFQYLFPVLPGSTYSHSFAGVFLFSVPMGLIALWLFHAILKQPLLSLLPTSHQRHLTLVAQGFSFGPPRRFALILTSLALGALTHIAWDSFTHTQGWMVQHIDILRLPIIEAPTIPFGCTGYYSTGARLSGRHYSIVGTHSGTSRRQRNQRKHRPNFQQKHA